MTASTNQPETVGALFSQPLAELASLWNETALRSLTSSQLGELSQELNRVVGAIRLVCLPTDAEQDRRLRLVAMSHDERLAAENARIKSIMLARGEAARLNELKPPDQREDYRAIHERYPLG